MLSPVADLCRRVAVARRGTWGAPGHLGTGTYLAVFKVMCYFPNGKSMEIHHLGNLYSEYHLVICQFAMENRRGLDL